MTKHLEACRLATRFRKVLLATGTMLAMGACLPKGALAEPFAYVPNTGSINVSVIDTATSTLKTTIDLKQTV